MIEHFPIVEIHWLDHTSNDDWVTLKEIPKILEEGANVSVGYLIKEDDNAYIIMMTIPKDLENPEATGSMAMRILKGTVCGFKLLVG